MVIVIGILRHELGATLRTKQGRGKAQGRFHHRSRGAVSGGWERGGEERQTGRQAAGWA